MELPEEGGIFRGGDQWARGMGGAEGKRSGAGENGGSEGRNGCGAKRLRRGADRPGRKAPGSVAVPLDSVARQEEAIEREHERGVSQQEIGKLEQLELKIPQRIQPVSEHRSREDEVEIRGLAIPKPEGATVKDRGLVAGRLARVVQEKERETDRLQEQTAKLQQQLEVTTDNKGEASLQSD